MSSLLETQEPSIEPFRATDATTTRMEHRVAAVTTTNDRSPQQQPRRNLTKAFEALCSPSDESGKEEKSDVFDEKVMNTLLSPVSVVMNPSTNRVSVSSTLQSSSEIEASSDLVSDSLSSTSLDRLELDLHPDLRLKLTTFTVCRVASYSIIHDINKEAIAMASYDPLVACLESSSESVSPLVVAGLGQAPHMTEATGLDASTVDGAVIDEEKWLLSSITNRTSNETAANTSTQCPATFLQAMGEKEYDLSSAATRTQLWKPSRSWWEAKSGKNPWIEPASHNKRWRYLWPLIHYHKFLHKCIKKLKRNGVDVKVSVSPVSVFLREEVCAVSDHLAAVSLFGSEEWMDCLQYFDGWTDVNSAESVRNYQHFVKSLPLRSLQEPVDVESPLLRNQIDEAFLRTIALQREQLRDSVSLHPPSSSIASASSRKTRHGTTTTTAPTTATAVSQYGGPPPMYPRIAQGGLPQPVPKQIHGVRRSRYYAAGGGWYPHLGCENLPIDASSVHSELSANSYPQPPHHHLMDPAQYMYSGAAYYHPSGTQSTDHSNSASYVYPEHYGWMDPSGYAMHYLSSPQYYAGGIQESSFPSPTNEVEEEEPVVQPCEAPGIDESTPYKYGDADQSYTMLSPGYWSHLDQATLAMGLATPAMVSPSTTPRRTVGRRNKSDGEDVASPETTANGEYPTTHCAPLLLHGHRSYYGNNSRPRHVVPPSPATQFMMSPQASFAYSYGYGFSPNRSSRSGGARHKVNSQTKPSADEEANDEVSYNQVTPLTDGKAVESPGVVSEETPLVQTSLTAAV